MTSNINMMVIGIDIDNTIFPLLEQILPHYNNKYNDKLTIRDFTQYDVTKTINPNCKNFFHEFFCSRIFQNPPYDGAVAIIGKLLKEYKIYFITAAYPCTLEERNTWLKTYFPYYSEQMLIRCEDKKLIKVDLLIDDYIENFKDNNCQQLIFEQPWNKEEIQNNLNIQYIDCWNDLVIKKIHYMLSESKNETICKLS